MFVEMKMKKKRVLLLFIEKKYEKFGRFKKNIYLCTAFRKCIHSCCRACARAIRLGYGVIGNTTDSGPVILGSSPSIPTKTFSILAGRLFLSRMSVF